MRALIEKDPRNAERIFPYIGGEEVNNDPRHAHHRYVIDFADFPLRREAMTKTWNEMTAYERGAAARDGIVPSDYPGPVAEDWPDLISIVNARVRPGRAKDNRSAYRKFWWLYAERRGKLCAAIEPLSYVFVIARVTAYVAIARSNSRVVFNEKMVVFPTEEFSVFSVLSSRVHEIWANYFTSTLGGATLNYEPSDCLANFPFPLAFESKQLEAVGVTYHDHRAALIIDRNEGMTRTYNRFHTRAERAADIARLRTLHAEMDDAVLRAYGWHDLAARTAPLFLDDTNEDDHKYLGRLFWPSDFRDEVLARLLALNAERVASERAAGLTAAAAEDDVEESDVHVDADA
jgi:hypothetical protein